MEIKNIYKNLSYSLKWLTFESITYQMILLAHQLMLFKVSSYKLYGAMGALFSTVYFVVPIISFSLESSLSPFFKKITQSKKTFRSLFIVQMLPTLLFIALAATLFIIFKNILQSYQSSFTVSYSFIVVILLLILSESIKKVLRGILYLAFKNKINASIEILSILTYITTIWIYYFVTNTITLHIIFIPMLATSLIATSILSFFVYNFYKTIPSGPKITQKAPILKVLQCRVFNFINQFTHNMFSGNFLIPFFALQFGLGQAGIFKLVSHISYGATSLMRKIFGWTSDAALAQTKDLAPKYKQYVFSAITQRLNHFLYAIGIFLVINIGKIVKCSNANNPHTHWPLIVFFLIITFSENLFIAYEKFYIAEEKNHYITFFNLLSIASLTIILALTSYIPQLALLVAIATTRLTIFGLLSIISYRSWAIKPQWKAKPLYIAASILASIACFSIL